MKLVVNNARPLASVHSAKEEDVVYLGDDKPVALTVTARPADKAERQSKNSSRPQECKPEKDVKQAEPNILKRGQKGRLKKMKEKYKDQDDEERRILMDLFKVHIFSYCQMKKREMFIQVKSNIERKT